MMSRMLDIRGNVLLMKGGRGRVPGLMPAYGFHASRVPGTSVGPLARNAEVGYALEPGWSGS